MKGSYFILTRLDESRNIRTESKYFRLSPGHYVYVGSAMGGLDALAFTAGIGENAAEVRKKCCDGLEFLGIEIDDERNTKYNGQEAVISAKSSKAKVYVIPTNEELIIARDTLRCVEEQN